MAGDEPVGLVGFDSLNQSVALSDKPFDENSSSDMGTVASALKAIADETGACAGVVHHPAKTEKGTSRVGRGSGALHGAVDFVYFIDQPDDAKPLQLNFHMGKARGRTKQLPRGFVMTKCKIDVEQSHDDAIIAMQSDREPQDFSEYLNGFTVKPFDSSPRDETLVLIPVALNAFESEAASVARTATKEAKGSNLKGDEKAIYAAIESLQEAGDRPTGFTAAEIIRLAGAGGGRRPALKSLAERKVICFGRDENGRLLNGEGERKTQYRLPSSPNDHLELQPTLDDSDLEN